jgi:hypothetical protein
VFWAERPFVLLDSLGHQKGRNPMRAVAHHRVRREVSRFENTGIAVQVISPDQATVDAMGVNMMDRRRVGAVMRQSFLGAAAQIDTATTELVRRG